MRKLSWRQVAVVACTVVFSIALIGGSTWQKYVDRAEGQHFPLYDLMVLVATYAAVVLGAWAVVAWRGQMIAQTYFDLALRVAGVMTELENARERALSAIRQSMQHSHPPTGFPAAIRSREYVRHVQAVSSAADALARLETEVAVLWAADMANVDVLGTLRRDAQGLAGYLQAEVDNNIFSKIANVITHDGLYYSGEAFAHRQQQMTQLAKDWLNYHLGRDGARAMKPHDFSQRLATITSATRTLAAADERSAQEAFAEADVPDVDSAVVEGGAQEAFAEANAPDAAPPVAADDAQDGCSRS